MTTGEMMFYSGVGLLTITIVLATVFAIKKPKYQPEIANAQQLKGETVPLQNSYPTQRNTQVAKKQKSDPNATVLMSTEAQTELMNEDADHMK